MSMRDLQGQAERPLHYRARPAMEVGLPRDRQARDGRAADESSASARAPHGQDNQGPFPWRIRRSGLSAAFLAFPGELPLDAPTLGEHNGQVLRDYLGYSPERISKLEADGIIRSARADR